MRYSSVQFNKKSTLSDNGEVMVTFSHHLPNLYLKDLNFFNVAKDMGFQCILFKEQFTGVMFKEDAGDEILRGTVYFYKMLRKEE